LLFNRGQIDGNMHYRINEFRKAYAKELKKEVVYTV